VVLDPHAVLERVLDGGEGAVAVVHACTTSQQKNLKNQSEVVDVDSELLMCCYRFQ
jgi:hypothetical protein